MVKLHAATSNQEFPGDSSEKDIQYILKESLKFAGPILFMGLQLSSAYTAIVIVVQQSVGKLSPIPFGSLFVNCFIWSLYGRMEKSDSILYPNLSGLFVGTFCVTIFHQFTPQKPWKMYGVIMIIAFICMYWNRVGDSKSLGLMGCVLSIVVSGSPLAVIRTVIKDKSTASLPFFTSIITWINNLSWVLFGLVVVHDPYIYVPNILGFVLSSLQMILFLIYGMPPLSKKGDSDSSLLIKPFSDP
jgi:solute carrier family 50 protein (sugar transporter)